MGRAALCGGKNSLEPFFEDKFFIPKNAVYIYPLQKCESERGSFALFPLCNACITTNNYSLCTTFIQG